MDFPAPPPPTKLGLAVLASVSSDGGDEGGSYISTFFTFVSTSTTDK